MRAASRIVTRGSCFCCCDGESVSRGFGARGRRRKRRRSRASSLRTPSGSDLDRVRLLVQHINQKSGGRSRRSRILAGDQLSIDHRVNGPILDLGESDTEPNHFVIDTTLVNSTSSSSPLVKPVTVFTLDEQFAVLRRCSSQPPSPDGHHSSSLRTSSGTHRFKRHLFGQIALLPWPSAIALAPHAASRLPGP